MLECPIAKTNNGQNTREIHSLNNQSYFLKKGNCDIIRKQNCRRGLQDPLIIGILQKTTGQGGYKTSRGRAALTGLQHWKLLHRNKVHSVLLPSPEKQKGSESQDKIHIPLLQTILFNQYSNFSHVLLYVSNNIHFKIIGL